MSFGSSAYSGGLSYTEHQLRISEDTAILGISLYVLGFGLGPLVFAPLSEVYIRLAESSALEDIDIDISYLDVWKGESEFRLTTKSSRLILFSVPYS